RQKCPAARLVDDGTKWPPPTATNSTRQTWLLALASHCLPPASRSKATPPPRQAPRPTTSVAPVPVHRYASEIGQSPSTDPSHPASQRKGNREQRAMPTL